MFDEYRQRIARGSERTAGWTMNAVSSWGRDGWDLGEWPYVVISHGTTPEGEHVVRCNVEGDLDYYVTPDVETRDKVTDWLAHFYWQNRGDVECSFEDMPAERRGPFSWARLDAEKVED